MANVRETLQLLGLSPKEIVCYLALLELGSAPAAQVARAAGMHRSMTQYTCQQLVRKGLLNMVRRKNAYIFTAEPPEKLLLLLERERRAIDGKEQRVRAILEPLQAAMRSGAMLPSIRYYEGIEGVERLLDDMPLVRRDVCTFSAGDYVATVLPDTVRRYRDKAGRHFRTKKIVRCRKYAQLHAADPNVAGLETRYFRDLEELKVDIQIVDDLVSLLSVDRSVPVGILLKHADIASALRAIFLQLWATLPSES